MSKWDEIIKTATARGYVTAEERYEEIILQFGPPKHAVIPSRETLNRYKGRLPDSLLDLWASQGWSSWQKGKIWLCDPELLRPVIEELFDGDPEYSADTVIPFAYNAFGRFYLWVKDYTYLDVDPLSNVVTLEILPGYSETSKKHLTSSEEFIYELNGLIDPMSSALDDFDEEAGEYKDMLPGAIERLGELEPGEIYGFFPALTMGGEMSIKNLQRTDLVAHLLFLFQLQKPTLMQYTLPAEGEAGFGNLTPIRPLGTPE